jgi:hypothetical protein
MRGRGTTMFPRPRIHGEGWTFTFSKWFHPPSGISAGEILTEIRRMWNENRPRRRRGPERGTGARFKTPEQWRAAIREGVLPRKTLQNADSYVVAQWLGISRALMYALMKKWGPKSLDDMKAGRF